jgi:hypothetical protein
VPLRSLPWAPVYYAATLAFALADGLAGANVRAVGFAAWPELRAFYYVLCGLCGWLAWRAPAWAAPVTLLESSVNVAVLCASLLAPGWGLAPEGAAANLPQLVINFLISGTAGTLAFYQSLWSLPGARGGRLR